MSQLIVGGVVIFGIILFRPQLKILLKYLLNIMVKNIAETPEGAAQVYDSLIEEAQIEYNAASDTLKSISGQLKSEFELKASLESNARRVERECASLIQEGKVDEARLLSEQRVDILCKLDICNESIERLGAAEKDAREVTRIFENNLAKLKTEKQVAVHELKLNHDLSKAYSNLDKLKKDPSSGRLLDAVEESAKQKSAMIAGARAVRELKAEASVHGNNMIRKQENEDFINSLIEECNSCEDKSIKDKSKKSNRSDLS